MHAEPFPLVVAIRRVLGSDSCSDLGLEMGPFNKHAYIPSKFGKTTSLLIRLTKDEALVLNYVYHHWQELPLWWDQ